MFNDNLADLRISLTTDKYYIYSALSYEDRAAPQMTNPETHE